MRHKFTLQYDNECGQNPICGLLLAGCLLLANISLSLSQQHGAAVVGNIWSAPASLRPSAEHSECARNKSFPAAIWASPCSRLCLSESCVVWRCRSDDRVAPRGIFIGRRSPSLSASARVCRLYVLSGRALSECCSLIAKNLEKERER